ncbi:MAG: hypothetical protein K2G51_00675 [Lachnospiraceae bacterium]|nr:hypothetical protein [Lachnospiraceae bacterium]
MKKRILSLALSAVILAGSMNSIVHASPQKPFHWRGWLGNYTFDWSDDTTVEMKNGDGSDVLSVNGQYIIDHMLPGSSWPMAKNGGGIPDDVKTVSCQVVKEDAYIIMPFDGYVAIGIEDENAAAAGDICVRAKAGDKVSMVPKNLVATYESEASIRSRWPNMSDERVQYEMRFANTTADDWTYNMKIYKEGFLPMVEQSYNPYLVENNTNELISLPMYSETDGVDSYAYLWFIYQVDAPDTEIKALEVDQAVKDRESTIHAADLRARFGFKGFDSSLQGWVEDPIYKGVWRYMIDGCNAVDNIYRIQHFNRPAYYHFDNLYTDGILTVQDNELYLEGRRMNIWRGTWTEPEYDIVNVQTTTTE